MKMENKMGEACSNHGNYLFQVFIKAGISTVPMEDNPTT
jgi:hypothetical protein